MKQKEKGLYPYSFPKNNFSRCLSPHSFKLGILGVGHIGKTLALTLAKAGHEVSVANSRGPETIGAEVLATWAEAVTAEQATRDKDVIILSIPLHRIPESAPLFVAVPEDTIVIDTSNYYPQRDNKIERIEAGQVESLWVEEQLGRPIAKAWNAIGSASFAEKGKPAGNPDRIAIPIAADRKSDREVTMRLVSDTGFDAFYTGPLTDSWRQQPGAPIYCTDLTSKEIEALKDTAEKERLPTRRDIAVAAITERVGDGKTNPGADYAVRLSRILYIWNKQNILNREVTYEKGLERTREEKLKFLSEQAQDLNLGYEWFSRQTS